MVRVTLLIGLGLCIACGPESQNSLFGAGTQGQTATATASGGSTGTSPGSTSGVDGSAEGVSASTTDPTLPGSSEGSADTGSPTTDVDPSTSSTTSASGSAEGTTSTGAGEESSSSTSTGAGEEEEDDGGVDAGVQPGNGMYEACEEAEDCGFDPELCIILSDADGGFLDGFCSETTCNNPAADCDAPPGAAPSACLDVTVDGDADSACVLDCGGGVPCPAGMTCYALTGISICG